MHHARSEDAETLKHVMVEPQQHEGGTDKVQFVWRAEAPDGTRMKLSELSLHFFGSVTHIPSLKSNQLVGRCSAGAFGFYLVSPPGLMASGNLCMAFAMDINSGSDKEAGPPVLIAEEKVEITASGVTVQHYKLTGNPAHPAYAKLEEQDGLLLTRSELHGA